MKVKLLLLATVFCSYIVFVPMIASFGNFSNAVQESLKGSVGVFSVCGGEALYGGGTIVGKNGEILTVAHIVPNSDCDVVVKTTDNTKVLGARVIKVDPIRDLALISVDTKTENTVYLAGRKLNTGETIFTVGAPSRLQGSVTKGIVSNTEVETPSTPGAIIYDITVLPGSSGGGVFNEEGELAGVIKAKLTTADNGSTLAVGIRRQAIVDFLKESMPNENYTRKVF